MNNINNKDDQEFIALKTFYNFSRFFTLYGYIITLVKINEKKENKNLYNIWLELKKMDMFEVVDYVLEFMILASETHKLVILALFSIIIILLSYTNIIKDTSFITTITVFIITLFLINVKDLLDQGEIIAISLITLLLLLFSLAINEKD